MVFWLLHMKCGFSFMQHVLEHIKSRYRKTVVDHNMVFNCKTLSFHYYCLIPHIGYIAGLIQVTVSLHLAVATSTY